MGGGDERSVGKISDRTRHSQHPLPCPPRQSEPFHRIRQQPLGHLIRPAPTLDPRIGEPRVAAALTRELQAACTGYTLGRGCRGLGPPVSGCGELTCREARYLDLQVESIEQRGRDPPAIAADLGGRAATVYGSVPEPPAGTGIHRRNELEGGGVVILQRRA